MFANPMAPFAEGMPNPGATVGLAILPMSWRGHPQALRLDNGPELVAECFMSWCTERRIELRYIQRANRLRMASSNDSTAPIAPKCSMLMCSNLSIRPDKSVPNGCRVTAKHGPTTP